MDGFDKQFKIESDIQFKIESDIALKQYRNEQKKENKLLKIK
jgi:hypothetical protein